MKSHRNPSATVPPSENPGLANPSGGSSSSKHDVNNDRVRTSTFGRTLLESASALWPFLAGGILARDFEQWHRGVPWTWAVSVIIFAATSFWLAMFTVRRNLTCHHLVEQSREMRHLLERAQQTIEALFLDSVKAHAITAGLIGAQLRIGLSIRSVDSDE